MISDVEQAMLATLMDSSEALVPKKKAGVVKTRQKLETAKIQAIVRFQPSVAAILNRGHPYITMEFIKTKKGARALLHEGYRYVINRRARDERIYFGGAYLFWILVHQIISRKDIHNHPPDEAETERENSRFYERQGTNNCSTNSNEEI